MSESHTDPNWEEALTEAGYPDFDSWWKAEKNLVEEGNFRGADDNASWSHVSRIVLDDGRVIYLKRQQNHFPNNVLLKLKRIATFELEWQNYQRLQAAGVPTLKIIHFASRKHDGNRQCIVVSEELKGMTPIDELIKCFQKTEWPSRKERLAIVEAIEKVIRKMHDAGIIHNALYGRHIYLNIPIEDGSYVIPDKLHACLIDLERTKFPGANSPKLIKNDLEKMYRRIPQWPARDCLWFLKKYLGIKKLTPEAKNIARQIAPTRKR
ncbi:hypothetical protein NT6N_35030 [Oceaniferula spumae]|uniref:Lipopolysaccharide kinase n=1 Tax=Oceaniferula spumae TaxID=2979115 RepID=A0AAT9FR57_9BACT